MVKRKKALYGLCLVSLISLMLSLNTGAFHFSWFTILTHSRNFPLEESIFLNLRLPQTLTAFTTGGLLALAGVIVQVLLRNPLADPYILGISGGANVAVLMSILLGFSGMYSGSFAFIGASVSILCLFLLNRKHFDHVQSLLLSGIILAAFWSAITSLLLTISPNPKIHGMLFWLMGDLNHDGISWVSLSFLGMGTLVTYFFANQLNILALGELAAQNLGIRLVPFYLLLYFLSAFLTATAVSLAGNIGFLGLVVPHIVRIGLKTADHKIIVPASVLLGGSLLCLADSFARSIIAPIQLPVGILTALLGIPLFLWILRRNSNKTRIFQ